MKRTITAVISMMVAMLLILGGCGTTQPQPNNKETLTIGFGASLENYNPTNGYETRASMIGLTYETLFVYDNGEIKPHLVDTFSWNESNTVLTLNLKHDIKFHDGEDFNASAVVKNLEWMKANPMYGWIMGLSSMEEINEIDDYTVTITYKNAYYAALQDLSLPVHTAIVSPRMLDLENPGVMNGTSGTGPFVYTEYENNIASFEKNNSYWGEVPQFEQIDVKYIPDANVRQMALKNNDIDVIFGSSWVSYDNYSDAIKDANVKGQTSEETIKTRYLSVNAQNPILADTEVRKAVSYAIDIDAITKGLLQDLEDPATSILSKNLPYCNIQPNTNYFKDNLLATDLLSGSGWKDDNGDGIVEKDGNNLTLRLIYPQELSLNKEIVEVLKSQLSEVGIDVKIEPKEYMLWGKAFMDGDYDLSLVITNGLPYDPQNTINPMLQGAFGEYVSINALNNGSEFFAFGKELNTYNDKDIIEKNYENIINFLMDHYIDIPLTAQKEIILYNTEKIDNYIFGGTANLFYPQNIILQ